MATFVENPAGMNFVLRDKAGPVGQYIDNRTATVMVLAKFQVGKKTYALYRSISYSVSSTPTGLVGTVTASDSKAMMHHEGTKPHIILPKHAKTLRFYSHGRIVYSKIVHHPGTKPNRFLTDNLKKVIN